MTHYGYWNYKKETIGGDTTTEGRKGVGTIDADLNKEWKGMRRKQDRRKGKPGKTPRDTREDPSETDGEEKLATKARRTIKEIDKVTRNLSQIVRENPNTKREIKDLTDKLRSMASQLMTEEIQEVLQTMEKRDEKETLVPITVEQISGAEAAKHKLTTTKMDTGTQTETWSIRGAGTDMDRVTAQDVA